MSRNSIIDYQLDQVELNPDSYFSFVEWQSARVILWVQLNSFTNAYGEAPIIPTYEQIVNKIYKDRGGIQC